MTIYNTSVYIKGFFLIILILISSISFAQSIIQKTWIGGNLEYFKVDASKIHVDFGPILHDYNYTVNDSIFHLWETSIKGNKLAVRRNYYLKIVHLTTDTLILLPLTKDSQTLVKSNLPTIYVDSTCLINPDLKFERLMFSSTRCNGFCPVQTLTFDSSGQIIFLGKKFTEPYIGLFEGIIPAGVISEFLLQLKSSAIERIPENTGELIDMPGYSLKLFFNNKVQVLYGNNFPYYSGRLLGFLSNIYKKANLRKRKAEYIFDFK